MRAAHSGHRREVIFQQITGQPSVLYYANSIFDDIGLSGTASIGVSIFKLAMTLGTTITVDRYGRKVLLYIGCTSMLIALVLLTVLFALPTTTAAATDPFCFVHIHRRLPNRFWAHHFVVH